MQVDSFASALRAYKPFFILLLEFDSFPVFSQLALRSRILSLAIGGVPDLC